MRPGAAPTPRTNTAGPPADGWDERVGFAYETLPTERAVRSATGAMQGFCLDRAGYRRFGG